MKKQLLKIISILIVLLLVPTGCSKESILPSTDETPDKPGNILTLDKALEAILPEEEANPYAKPGFVRAITVGENSYLYDFKGKRVIILENTAEGFMNTNREDIVYLKNDGNLYFSDSDLTAPKLIDSNLSDFTNNAFSCQFTGHLTPVTGYHFIAAIRLWTHQSGGKYAVLLDTLHHFHHVFIHSHLKRVVWEIADFIQWNVQDAFPTGFIALSLSGKEVIYTQQIGHAVFPQSPSPPSQARDMHPLPGLWVRAERCSYLLC